MKQRVRVVAIIRKGEQVLILKRNSGRAEGATFWELPTGKIGVGEQPEEAMTRNLEEFLGAKTSSIRLVDAITFVGLEEASRLLNLYLIYEVQLEDLENFELTGKYTAFKFVKDFSGIRLSEATGTVVQIEGLGTGVGGSNEEGRTIIGGLGEMTEKGNKKKISEKRGLERPHRDKTARKTAGAPILMVDGASRGNPGASGVGYVIFGTDGKVIERGGDFIGFATSRVAEYMALKKGLERALELGIKEIRVISDNLMVINQMKGIFKVKNQDIMEINQDVRGILQNFQAVSFQQLPRSQTAAADKEANLAIDRVMKK